MPLILKMLAMTISRLILSYIRCTRLSQQMVDCLRPLKSVKVGLRSIKIDNAVVKVAKVKIVAATISCLCSVECQRKKRSRRFP